MRSAIVCIGALSLLPVTGCGSASSEWGRIPIVGTAQVDGSPFSGGISFRPTDGTTGPSTMTRVKDGQFAFDKRSGPVPGAHRVILIPAPDPNNRNPPRIDTQVNVPEEPPYEMNLVFTTPEPEPLLREAEPAGAVGVQK